MTLLTPTVKRRKTTFKGEERPGFQEGGIRGHAWQEKSPPRSPGADGESPLKSENKLKAARHKKRI